MKTAAAAATFILAAGLVAAEPQHHALPSGTKINCAKANASYCMGGDIILRCGPDALGEPARCSPANVSGYPPPPAGAVAECWESSRDAGDAACQKNCVVYAQDPFTLPADKCTPAAAQTGQPASTGSTTSGSGPLATSSTGFLALPDSSTAPTSAVSSSSSSSSSAYISLPSFPPGTPPGTASTPTHTGSNSTITLPIITGSTSTATSTSTTTGGGGGSIITLTSTAGPKPTATTTPPPNSNDASANNAKSGLFAFGLAVAALF
ncbi:hypothetical protein NHJ13734_009529 [Beauveria thailandica]